MCTKAIKMRFNLYIYFFIRSNYSPAPGTNICCQPEFFLEKDNPRYFRLDIKLEPSGIHL